MAKKNSVEIIYTENTDCGNCPECNWEASVLYKLKDWANGVCGSCFAEIIANEGYEVIPPKKGYKPSMR